MADVPPPKLQADERTTLVELLQYTRESFVRTVEGVSDDDARRRSVDSDTTLLWLVKHVRWAEEIWLRLRFAGEDASLVGDAVVPDDTVAGAVEAYRAAWVTHDAIVLAAPSLDEVCRGPGAGDPPVNLRWVLADLLEEIARHAGHADILRELLDGSTGR